MVFVATPTTTHPTTTHPPRKGVAPGERITEFFLFFTKIEIGRNGKITKRGNERKKEKEKEGREREREREWMGGRQKQMNEPVTE